jgi:hypothetical protein
MGWEGVCRDSEGSGGSSGYGIGPSVQERAGRTGREKEMMIIKGVWRRERGKEEEDGQWHVLGLCLLLLRLLDPVRMPLHRALLVRLLYLLGVVLAVFEPERAARWTR